jgi:putative ABC transport system permease protein
VALAFLLAAGTGLLVKSFLRLTGVDAGFDPRHVFTLTLTLTGERYAKQDAMLAYYRQVVDKARSQPGVLDAAMADNVPLSHTTQAKLRIEGAPNVTDADAPSADLFWTSPDYFRVLKIPLKRGRFFTDHDGLGGPAAAIVGESLAATRFPSVEAIGRRIQLGPQWFTIVGIAGDVRNNGLDHVPDEAVYIPHSLNTDHYTRLLVRTAGQPMNSEQSILAAIRDVDPQQAAYHIQSMEAYVASSLAYRSFTLTLISMFGTFAVLLAGMGIYGVISYLGLRTREVGIRMALGAQRFEILKLVLRDVFLLLACGLAAGFLAALAGDAFPFASAFRSASQRFPNHCKRRMRARLRRPPGGIFSCEARRRGRPELRAAIGLKRVRWSFKAPLLQSTSDACSCPRSMDCPHNFRSFGRPELS